MRVHKAFTLIELMVIVGIIGIITVIAYPNYKKYIISARLTEAAEAAQHLMHESIAYAADHGLFANAYDVGLTNNPGDFYLFDDALASERIPYYFPGAGSGMGFNGYDPCGDVANVYIWLDPDKVGMSDDYIYLNCFMWHYEDTINNACFYAYANENGTGTDPSLIPGWINENTTTENDRTNWNERLINNPSFINRTCQ